MTKYVIQSGGLKSHPDKAREYFKELFMGCGESPTFMWCFFASNGEDYNERADKYNDLFSPFFPVDVTPVFVTATEEDFADQLKTVDIIYLHGGYVDNLAKRLGHYDLSQMFEGKTVGTNSASAMYVAEHSWSCDSLELKDGIGLVPIKVIAHYKSTNLPEKGAVNIDWEVTKAELELYGDKTLPVHALKEGEFIVIKQ